MTARTPQEVFAEHGRHLATGDLDLIAGSYAEDAVLITPEGAFRGHDGVRRILGRLLADLPDADRQLDPQFADDLLFLRWSAATATRQVTDGVDTFVFRAGLVRAQTLTYTLTERA
ncbi:nuclear transport factor 2 family protein [Kitasatospora sp. NPDC059795]|uniref:nuclear transport factor 2 family protein n=1 Tax=Kitasatospora sp. NPDC059795 TaxID=3346949 RepID=UPI00364E0D11